MRHRQRLHLVALMVLAPLLAACSGGEDEPTPVAAAPVDDGLRLVQSITDIELGRTANGYALSVFGLSNTAGWSRPTLRMRDDVPDADGFVHFDFVAIPPRSPSLSPMATLPEARRVRADRLFTEAALAPVGGLRIWTETGASDVTFN